MSSLPGDDIFGLQSALFQAGVHTVLGGLWSVETQAACAVTSEFHRNYAQGDAAELALQKAVLRWLGEHEGAGTFLWAPFFLSSLGTAGVPQAVN
jgi:CHAT domain-containing protein